MRIIAFYWASIVVTCSFQPLLSQTQNRPNILVLIADDMGTDAFAPYNIGTDLPNTPNLDNLSQQGVLFMNAWGYATCAPSRASLLTGRYGNKNGVVRSGPNLPLEEVTLFEHIEQITSGAYANAVFGKWHLGGADHPNLQGVQHYNGHLSSGVDDYFLWERTIDGVTDVSDTYVTTYMTDLAIDWLDNQTQPWLLWMAYNAPHSPIHLPPDSLYTRTQTDSSFDRYMCMIESVDHEVGRLYNTLSQEEKDNTIIIFVGDNGTPNSRLQTFPSRHGKGTVYEGGIRVPMFITGYGVNRIGEKENAMVSFSDLFATLTELLGTDLPGGIDNSFSLYPLLSDAEAKKRTYNYSELMDGELSRAIRNEQYKLIKFGDGVEEFYDLLADPFERMDLMQNGLSTEQMQAKEELAKESDLIFQSWSCNDQIQNGNELDIDCGGSFCSPCMITSSNPSVELSNQISIFPNPVTSSLRIHAPQGKYSFRIFDARGILHQHQEWISNDHTLDLSSLTSGIYFLDILEVESLEVTRKKLVKY